MTYGRGSDSADVPAWATEDDLAFLESYPEHPTSDERSRMVHLCTLEPAAPWSVLAVTFTNKAANELRERLSAFGIRGAESVWAMTFHSACVRILRRDIDRLGFSRDFTIYDTDDSKRVIKDILKELNIDEKKLTPREVLSAISNAKDAMESHQDYSRRWKDSGDWRKEQSPRSIRATCTVWPRRTRSTLTTSSSTRSRCCSRMARCATTTAASSAMCSSTSIRTRTGCNTF